jgi:hypothetical protein
VNSQKSATAQLTRDPEDKDPDRKKQQQAVSGSDKKKRGVEWRSETKS